MDGTYHFIVSFKSRGEVARELKFRSHVPFALPDSGTVVESGLIFFVAFVLDSCTFCTGIRRQDGDFVRRPLS